MTRNKSTGKLRRSFVAFGLALLTIASFLPSFMVSAANELTIVETTYSTAGEVVTSSAGRTVLYNTGGAELSGYDAYVSKSEFSLDHSINEDSLNAWVEQLNTAYEAGLEVDYSYNPDLVTGAATVCSDEDGTLVQIVDQNKNPVLTNSYYYYITSNWINNSNNTNTDSSCVYLGLDIAEDGSGTRLPILSSTPTKWQIQSDETSGDATSLRFYHVDKGVWLNIVEQDGANVLTITNDDPTIENRTFTLDFDAQRGNGSAFDILNPSYADAHLSAEAVRNDTSDFVSLGGRSGNHNTRWHFEYADVQPYYTAPTSAFPSLQYSWKSSDPSIADINDSGDVRIYKEGLVTFTCTVSADNGYTAATAEKLGVEMEKTFSVTYDFTQYRKSTADNPLEDTDENAANFPEAGQPGSVTIVKSQSGAVPSFGQTGVTRVTLEAASLASNEPIDVVLVIDISRSMVDFHNYDVVYCEGSRTEEYVTNSDTGKSELVDVEYSGSRNITYVIKKGYLNKTASPTVPYSEYNDVPVEVYDLGGSIAYYCVFDSVTGEYSLYAEDPTVNADAVALKTSPYLTDIAPDGYYGEDGTASDEYIKNYNKIQAARESAATFVNTLLDASPDSRVALVQFSDDKQKDDGSYYKINSRVICNYTNDRQTLLDLIANDNYSDTDNRYAKGSNKSLDEVEDLGYSLGNGAGYDRYSPTTAELAGLEANAVGSGLTISNIGGTNYGLAFERAEEAINADLGNPDAHDIQMLVFMTDGEPNTLNLANATGDSLFGSQNEGKNNDYFDNDSPSSWAYFALRRQFEAKNRIEDLGYEIISIGFDLDSDGTGYFSTYEEYTGEAAADEYSGDTTYVIDENENTNKFSSSLIDDIGYEGAADETPANREYNALIAMRKQVVKNIASYEKGYYSVEQSSDVKTDDYSSLSRAYDDIADSIFFKTTEAVVSDTISDSFELRILPYNNTYSTGTDRTGPTIVVTREDIDSSNNRSNAVTLETVTFSGSTLAGGVDVYHTYIDEDGVAHASEKIATLNADNVSNYTISGKYFTYNSKTKEFVWTIGDIINEHYSLSYDAYLTNSDPAYEIAMGRTNSTWVDGSDDHKFRNWETNIDTNKEATITYKNFNGEYCIQTYEKPKVNWVPIEATVVKKWVDNDYAQRPTTIKAQLVATVNGVSTDVGIVREVGYSYTWEDLPMYQDGLLITYSVREVDVPAEYDASYDKDESYRLRITNTLKTFDVVVKYVDEDNNTVKTEVLAYDDLARGKPYDVVGEKNCRDEVITSDESVDGKNYYFVKKLSGEESSSAIDANKEIVYQYTLLEDPKIEKAVDKKSVNLDSGSENRELTYTLKVSNSNSVELKNVTVTDTLPAGVTFKEIVSGATLTDNSNGTLTFNVPSVAANGGVASIVFTVTLDDTVNAQPIGSVEKYINSAKVTSAAINPDGTGEDITVNYTNVESNEVETVVYKDPTIVKEVSTEWAHDGETFQYTLTITNNDAFHDIYNVDVRDVIPDGLEYVAPATAVYSENCTDNVVTWTVPNIEKGQSVQLTFSVRVTDRSKAKYANTGYIDASDVDLDSDGTIESTDVQREFPDNSNRSNTVYTDVYYTLVVKHLKYDENAEGNLGEPLITPEYTSEGQRGTSYDANSQNLSYITTSTGEVWVKKLVTADSDEFSDIYDSDKEITILYEKFDSLYTIIKQVRTTGGEWTNAVTVAPDTSVEFRIIVRNTSQIALSGLSLSDVLAKNGSTWPHDFAAILQTFPGTIDAAGEWISPAMSMTASGSGGDQYINTATIASSDPTLPELSSSATVNIVAPGVIGLTKTAVAETDAESGKKYVAPGLTAFTLIVSNPGESTLTNVTVVDEDYDVILIDENLNQTVVPKGTPIGEAITLAPSQSRTYTVYISIPETDVDNTLYHNDAIATGTDPLGSTVTDTDGDEVVLKHPIDPTTLLRIIKQANGKDARDEALFVSHGDIVSYTVTIINDSEVDMNDLYVVDHMLSGSDVISEDWAIDANWTVDIPAGGSYTIPGDIFNWTMPLYTPAGTVITNKAVLYSSEESFNNGDEPLDDDIAMIEAAPCYKIEVVKTADVPTVMPGSSAGFTINVTNKSNALLENIVVTDSLTGEWGTLPTTTSGGNAVNVTLNSDNTLTIDKLASEDTVRLSFTHAVDASISGSDLVNNVKAETIPTGSDTPVSDDDNASVGLVYNSLEIVKVADREETLAGDTITWRISVTNTGENALTNVAVTDSMAVRVIAELTEDENGAFVTASDLSISNVSESESAAYAPDTLIGMFDTLAAGECRIIVAQSTVPTDTAAGTVITNTATATSDGHRDTDSGTVTVAEPPVREYILNIEKTANTTMAAQGDTVNYTITVHNSGKDDLTDVVITDSLNVLYNSQTVTAGSAIATIPLLRSGESESVVVSYTIPENYTGSKLTNTAYADSNETGKTSDSADVTLEDPKITISKTVSSREVSAGEKVYYTLTVTNTGNCKLTNLVVSDEKINFSYTIPELDVGKKWTSDDGDLFYTFSSSAASGTTFQNSATVSNGVVKGSSTSTSEVKNSGPKYETPETGEGARSETARTNAWNIAILSFAICLTAAALFIRRRSSRKQTGA